VLAFFSFAVAAHAAAVPPQSEGFTALYNLDYDRAVSLFEESVKRSPDNPEAWNHLAQSLLYRALYRSGALDSGIFSKDNAFLKKPRTPMPAPDEKRFVEAITTSLALTGMRLRKDPNDQGALYAQGVAYAHRAQFFLLVKKANLDALRDGTRSRKAHNRLLQLNRSMADARLIPGMHEYVVGSLPRWVKALVFLAGFSGDRKKGIEYIESAAASGMKTGVEARVLLSLVYRRERQPEKGVPLVRELAEAFPRNHLYRSEVALLLAASGRHAEAISAVEQIERLKRDNHSNVSAMSQEMVARLRRAVEASAGKSKQ
jgi:tetratricopeptide (TPR) repeat protein